MLFNELIAKYRRWKSIRNTVAALDRLSTHELDDLGISRWQIQNIARRHSM